MSKATMILMVLGAFVTLFVIVAVEQATKQFRALRDGQAAIIIEIHGIRR